MGSVMAGEAPCSPLGTLTACCGSVLWRDQDGQLECPICMKPVDQEGVRLRHINLGAAWQHGYHKSQRGRLRHE